tara:strand:- start:1785 stop:2027 length:243 start_codon:yes stop_codon:yes gene_type:complete
MRKWLGRLTSPFFVPLRRFIVWGDKTFGTCDMKLTLEPRYQDHPLRGFADIDESTNNRLSELQIKLSKDRANIEGLGESE